MPKYKQVTGPALEPVTLEEVKNHLRISGSDEDSLLNVLIQVAREYCENYTNRQFITATWDLYDDCFQPKTYIQRNPVLAISAITYYDSANALQTLNAAYYELDNISEPAELCEASTYSFPSTYNRKNAVKVRFTAGYGATASLVPAAIRQALLLVIAFLYENRGDEGHRTMPTSITNLLDSYRVSIFS